MGTLESAARTPLLLSFAVALIACSGAESNGDAASAHGGSAAVELPASGSAGRDAAAGSAGGSATPQASAPGEIAGCPLFPADDAWNADISGAAVDAAWTEKLRELAEGARLHPDYGGSGSDLYGIPFNIVPAQHALVDVKLDWCPDESDPGPHPFPDASVIKIEGNRPEQCDGDCHVLIVQSGACLLIEGYACEHRADGWHCGNTAKWDLRRNSYGQRPKGWTSADAAGLPIAPGLLRYAEVAAGEVKHALRFTLRCTTNRYVAPATHFAMPEACANVAAPPMGTRVRLRADFDISGFSRDAQVVLRGMQKYGMILADNGSNFFFQGEAHPDWSEDAIEPLKDVPASAFEVIQMPPLEP